MSNTTYNSYIERDDDFSGNGNHRSILAPDIKMRLNFFGASAAKEQWRGINLPPFDVSLIRDPKDKESYIESTGPCWSDVPDETRFYLPGPWSRKFIFYTFLGESNTHFMSPRNRKKFVTNRDYTDMDLADAFDDIRFFVKNSKALTEQQRKGLLDKTKQGDRYFDAPVPQGTFRHVLFSEYWSVQNATPRVELMAITASAYKHLIDQMRWLVDDRNPSIGSTCKQYLLGDALSDPAGALVWFPIKREVGDFGLANVMAYTSREQNTVGFERRAVSRESLRQRFLLTEESNWNIPSYQDMVDFAVNELPNIPIEIIKQACGSRADVGDRGTSYANAVQPRFDPTAQTQESSRYAAAGSPPMGNSAPVPAVLPTVPAADPSYLVGIPGSVPVMTPLSGLVSVMNSMPTAMVQMPDGNWLPLSASGLVKVAAPAVPTVPTANTVPSLPNVPVPASSTASAVAGEVGGVEDLQYFRRFCPDERYARMTDAGRAEVDDVAQTLRQMKIENKPVDGELMRRVANASRHDYLG
jgi:hypothetical protein